MVEKHLMIDLETLGNVPPDAVILSVGAVLFTKDEILGEREWILNIDDQLRRGRRTNASTLNWWLKQSKEAQDVIRQAEHGISVESFIGQLASWLIDDKFKVWGHPSFFDVAMLDHLHDSINVVTPWTFRDVRCYRTVKALHKIEEGMTRAGVHHNALDDARFQAKCLQKFLAARPD